MKGLVFTALDHVALQEVEKPGIIQAEDVIIRITLTTICGSDVHLVHGHIPSTPGYVLGHEYVGVIDQVGSSVRNFKPGDRVIGPGAVFCGQCDYCRAGHLAQCRNGGIHGSGPEYGNIPGTHSEFVRVPFADANLLHVPDELSDEQVLFVGDILSTGYFAVEKAEIRPGDTIVIFGPGPVGLAAVQTARLFNPSQIILVGRNPFRLEMGKELGATHVINTNDGNVLTAIQSLTGGKGADAAIEAVGSEITLQQAVRCVGVGGRVSIVGVGGQNVSLPMFEIFMKNIRIEMGLVYLGHMQRLLRMVQTGQINLLPLVTHRMKLSEIEEAFELFENKRDHVIKVAITP